ncbi:hypothetical protein [Bizionia sp. M204]|uniref:hypothetical protein n=1 Tax=Bizionia sp. M204 TaxID=2675331 RepID=UPI0020555681|nr:hypothetical protein [Bizionia sp. M204]UPS90466.1 hypothetical protein GMA17_01465 [Bizionia sp. M204]
MITQELLSSEKGKNIILPEDLDTTNFILSLYEQDDLDITEAKTFLKNYISVKNPMEALALNFIAHNFQYYKQTGDTIFYDLGFDNVYGSIVEHSVLGFYALLKEFITPYKDDWKLKQVRTFNPLNNCFEERDSWVSEKAKMSIEWAAGSRMIATIICSEFDKTLLSLNKRLYDKLDKKNLALFYDMEDFEELTGSDDYRDLKNTLLL